MTSQNSSVTAASEIYFENGVHYLEDGHYWIEVPGLPHESQDEDFYDESIVQKCPRTVKFSQGNIKVHFNLGIMIRFEF
jgi:neurabin